MDICIIGLSLVTLKNNYVFIKSIFQSSLFFICNFSNNYFNWDINFNFIDNFLMSKVFLKFALQWLTDLLRISFDLQNSNNFRSAQMQKDSEHFLLLLFQTIHLGTAQERKGICKAMLWTNLLSQRNAKSVWTTTIQRELR